MGQDNITNQIKSDKNTSDEIALLLDEAKTMWAVGSYHENIVNLQGITVGVVDQEIHRVSR